MLGEQLNLLLLHQQQKLSKIREIPWIDKSPHCFNDHQFSLDAYKIQVEKSFQTKT